MNRTVTQYEERARELMLGARERRAFVSLNVNADTVGECPACAVALDGFESQRVGHVRTCRALLDLVCSDAVDEVTGTRVEDRAEQQQLVDAAAASFPATFGLRKFAGRFRIDARSSFYSDVTGVQLVVQRETTEADAKRPSAIGVTPGYWLDFTRDTPTEIRELLSEVRR